MSWSDDECRPSYAAVALSQLCINTTIVTNTTQHHFTNLDYKNFNLDIEKADRLFNAIKTDNVKKLNKLKSVQAPKEIHTNNWLVNFSKTELPSEIKDTLSLGPNHGLPYKNVNLPIDDILSSVELALITKDGITIDKVRSNISQLIGNRLVKHPPKSHCQITSKVKQTIEFLKQNNHLVVTDADKGNISVVMDKTDVEQKYQDILNDSSTYTLISRDPTIEIQKQVNDMISLWQQKKFIDSNSAKNLKTHKSPPPKIYFLSKIHKNNVPLRPIVCTSNYHIQDTRSFVNKIRNTQTPPEHLLVSLDVKSLFTNISTKLAISLISRNWPNLKSHTNINKKEFLAATKLCLDSCYFAYEDKFYQQIFGVAMGSPISPVVANLIGITNQPGLGDTFILIQFIP
ncbi:uncharacterized protein [Neodiprion pinetum]|uniref:uncharacterized protein n=1 Tax=Neodiprion pinetum TaxID=441929 RepID=UPI00371FEF4E